jgi:1-acyl-sn-glycerol-3-phosphate acyltransferase
MPSMPPLRSLLLNAALYVSLVGIMIAAVPTLVMPRGALMAFVRAWGRYYLWLCRVVGGIKVEFRHRERIPPGPLLIASKHQSIWETFALLSQFDDPCFILKHELTWIPLFGWYAVKAHMLPVDRRGGAAVMARLNRQARDEVRNGEGRQILFFPEGTRRPAGAPPKYRHGISHVYENLDVPCLPIGLNSGLFWPRRSLNLLSGTVLVEFLEPVPPGLSRDVFLPLIQERIEESSNRLLAEGLAELGPRAPVLRSTEPARDGADG